MLKGDNNLKNRLWVGCTNLPRPHLPTPARLIYYKGTEWWKKTSSALIVSSAGALNAVARSRHVVLTSVSAGSRSRLVAGSSHGSVEVTVMTASQASRPARRAAAVNMTPPDWDCSHARRAATETYLSALWNGTRPRPGTPTRKARMNASEAPLPRCTTALSPVSFHPLQYAWQQHLSLHIIGICIVNEVGMCNHLYCKQKAINQTRRIYNATYFGGT